MYLLFAIFLGGCSMRQMIYPAPPVPVGEPPAWMEEVEVEAGDGVSLVGWYWEPDPSNPNRPVIVFLHGNGENLETMRSSSTLEQIRRLRSPFLVVDYPGYGRSSGFPSEASLKRGAAAAVHWAFERFDGREVVICGWSLGAAVAIHTAATEPEVVALIAMSAWTSLEEVAANHFPGWLVGVLLRESYDSVEVGVEVEVPSLLIHGSEDSIIPIEQGRRVAAQIPRAQWLELAGAGHNDLLSFPEVWEAIEAFVGLVAESSRV